MGALRRRCQKLKYGPREIAKAGNLVEVNLGLNQQAKLLEELRRHIDNEVLQVFRVGCHFGHFYFC